MSRKVGQIIARGERRWLVRVYVGRDCEASKRKYHNRTIYGPLRQAQAYLNKAAARTRSVSRCGRGTSHVGNVCRPAPGLLRLTADQSGCLLSVERE